MTTVLRCVGSSSTDSMRWFQTIRSTETMSLGAREWVRIGATIIAGRCERWKYHVTPIPIRSGRTNRRPRANVGCTCRGIQIGRGDSGKDAELVESVIPHTHEDGSGRMHLGSGSASIPYKEIGWDLSKKHQDGATRVDVQKRKPNKSPTAPWVPEVLKPLVEKPQLETGEQLKGLIHQYWEAFPLKGELRNHNGRSSYRQAMPTLLRNNIPHTGTPLLQRRGRWMLGRNAWAKGHHIVRGRNGWASPIVMVKKMDGSWCSCSGFRKISCHEEICSSFTPWGGHDRRSERDDTIS